MPGTGAEHLAGGQPPIGRALHDFGCPDGASEFSARFEEQAWSAGYRLAGAWHVWVGACKPVLIGPTREASHYTQ